MKSPSFALIGLFLSSVLASPTSGSKNDQPINDKGKGAPLLGKGTWIYFLELGM